MYSHHSYPPPSNPMAPSPSSAPRLVLPPLKNPNAPPTTFMQSSTDPQAPLPQYTLPPPMNKNVPHGQLIPADCISPADVRDAHFGDPHSKEGAGVGGLLSLKNGDIPEYTPSSAMRYSPIVIGRNEVRTGRVTKNTAYGKTMAERNREEAKRLQNRESAKRFRRMQKMRWQKMKEDLEEKDLEIGRLKERIGSLEQFGNDGCQGVKDAVLELYAQMLAWSPQGGETGKGGLYAGLLGVHFRTLLVGEDGCIAAVLKKGMGSGKFMQDGVVGGIGCGFWEDVEDQRQMQMMGLAVAAKKPVAIAYERNTSEGPITVNAALAPVKDSEQVVVAEFVDRAFLDL